MQNNLTKELKQYYGKIKKLTLVSGKAGKEMLSQLQTSIGEYVLSNPECSIGDIQNRFGTPEEIAQANLLNEEGENAVKRVRANYFAKIIAVWGTIIAAVLAVSIFTIVVWNDHNTSMGYNATCICENNKSIYYLVKNK